MNVVTCQARRLRHSEASGTCVAARECWAMNGIQIAAATNAGIAQIASDARQSPSASSAGTASAAASAPLPEIAIV